MDIFAQYQESIIVDNQYRIIVTDTVNDIINGRFKDEDILIQELNDLGKWQDNGSLSIQMNSKVTRPFRLDCRWVKFFNEHPLNYEKIDLDDQETAELIRLIEGNKFRFLNPKYVQKVNG